ncbi:hypothetical protein MPL1_03078 [Methylophaga lonarensis MPL]|uniref:DUF5610 domain-containing protein n=1 Tax=Methylophaga lonarensis MPL TaxID=1286106 RepID=M7P306_9GAMM|nr:DUF5610 domain-containing protein [Methylophaga lonarensis]EMR13877.1 hypothetical protein MPL1_03078 [Methylophaga lonarensis MPL]
MTSAIQPFGQTVKNIAQDPANKTERPLGQQISELAKSRQSLLSEAKSEFNRNLIEVTISVSNSRGDSSMSLLLKTAIEGINDALKDDFGDNAIQNAYEQGIDVSPEATADRIVQMSTAFFDAYYASRQDMPLEEALQSFVEVIGRGIDQGFKEARDILSGLQVLQGEIASNIDKTYDLVQQGLQDFLQQRLPASEE